VLQLFGFWGGTGDEITPEIHHLTNERVDTYRLISTIRLYTLVHAGKYITKTN